MGGGAPETEEQVREVLAICREHEVPVVPRGAGTGLSGGARPVRDGLVLGLSKLNRILEVDLETALPGCSPGCATWPSARRRRPMAFTTPRILPPSSPAASAATWPRTPVACIA